jgi:hypothetical protein
LLPAADATAILRVKVWLTGISPMVWRRVLVPSSFTLRERKHKDLWGINGSELRGTAGNGGARAVDPRDPYAPTANLVEAIALYRAGAAGLDKQSLALFKQAEMLLARLQGNNAL